MARTSEEIIEMWRRLVNALAQRRRAYPLPGQVIGWDRDEHGLESHVSLIYHFCTGILLVMVDWHTGFVILYKTSIDMGCALRCVCDNINTISYFEALYFRDLWHLPTRPFPPVRFVFCATLAHARWPCSAAAQAACTRGMMSASLV